MNVHGSDPPKVEVEESSEGPLGSSTSARLRGFFREKEIGYFVCGVLPVR